MTIDIVDLSSEQYKDLSPVQLAMVRAAQARKDTAVQTAEQEKRNILYLMLTNGTARSLTRTLAEQQVDAALETQIEFIREDLNYQLAYEAIGTEGNENGPYRYPDNPNYNLTPAQRFLVVRNYYMNVTQNAEARLTAYSMDSLARTYLGEYYQTLYDILASYVK